jgi:alpha-galactosidase
LPLIAAAAKAGCEYFVIDAGWYAEIKEDWSQTIGSWQPSSSRWPHGLKFVLDQIPTQWNDSRTLARAGSCRSKITSRQEARTAGFFMRHGKRVLKNSRYLLDFRNPEVRAYLDEVIARLVNDYGVGYIKMATTSIRCKEQSSTQIALDRAC